MPKKGAWIFVDGQYISFKLIESENYSSSFLLFVRYSFLRAVDVQVSEGQKGDRIIKNMGF